MLHKEWDGGGGATNNGCASTPIVWAGWRGGADGRAGGGVPGSQRRHVGGATTVAYTAADATAAGGRGGSAWQCPRPRLAGTPDGAGTDAGRGAANGGVLPALAG